MRATSSRDWEGGNSQSLENEMTSQSHCAARNDSSRRSRVSPEIEVVHGERDGHVGVGVEAPDELLALIRQVGADGKPLLEIGDDVAGRMPVEVELPGHRFGRQIGDVPEHSGEREAGLREIAGAVVLAAVKVGVRWIAFRPTTSKAIACAVTRAEAAMGIAVWTLLRVARRPAKRLVTSEGAADDGTQALDAE